MENINPDPNQCRYVVITGSTIKELENNINDLIAQGWNMEKFIGGIEADAKGYYQAVLICPGSDRADQALY